MSDHLEIRNQPAVRPMVLRSAFLAAGLMLGLLAAVQPALAQSSMGASSAPSSAENSKEPAAAAASDQWSSCAAVAMDPQVVATQLENWDTVFGKPAIEWTEEDYKQLLDLAYACNGAFTADGVVVDGKLWYDAISKAEEEVFPVAGVHQEIMRRAAQAGADQITYPACAALVTYIQDDIAMTDGSKALFGVDYMAMTDADLQRAIDHINNCTAFLPDFASDHLGVTKRETNTLLNQMMTKALYIQAHRNEWKYWRGKKPTDLIVKIDGVEILPTFTSAKTRAMVQRFNRAASFPGGFSLETISALVQIADDILNDSPTAYDADYANEVKRLVQKDIFDRTEVKLDPAAPAKPAG